MNAPLRLSRLRTPRFTPASVTLIVATYVLYGAVLYAAFAGTSDAAGRPLPAPDARRPGFVTEVPASVPSGITESGRNRLG